MHGHIPTNHFNERFQQRGLKQTVVEILLRYGEQRSCRDGATSIGFTKAALAEIKADYGATTFRDVSGFAMPISLCPTMVC